MLRGCQSPKGHCKRTRIMHAIIGWLHFRVEAQGRGYRGRSQWYRGSHMHWTQNVSGPLLDCGSSCLHTDQQFLMDAHVNGFAFCAILYFCWFVAASDATPTTRIHNRHSQQAPSAPPRVRFANDTRHAQSHAAWFRYQHERRTV